MNGRGKNNGVLVLTPEEARRILRCSRSVLYSGLKNGAIPCIHLGPRKVIIPRLKLLAMLGADEEAQHGNSESPCNRGT